MFQREGQLLVASSLHSIQLASERTESERVGKAAVTDLAIVGDALPRPGLRPLIEKHNLGAVDDIGLNARDVDVPLDFIHPHHIMIRGSPNLKQAMTLTLVVDGAVRAQRCAAHAVQAEQIALGITMNAARNEIIRSKHC